MGPEHADYADPGLPPPLLPTLGEVAAVVATALAATAAVFAFLYLRFAR